MRFLPYSGDLIKLPTSENHLIFRWVEPDCKVLFSVCRQGNGASCHFASDKKGIFKIKRAINEFCEFVFDWCEMIIAKVMLNKIGLILEKCGFKKIVDGKINIYIRKKSWVS
jgi:hypothetical protein